MAKQEKPQSSQPVKNEGEIRGRTIPTVPPTKNDVQSSESTKNNK